MATRFKVSGRVDMQLVTKISDWRCERRRRFALEAARVHERRALACRAAGQLEEALYRERRAREYRAQAGALR
jgi:hypothetical protein